MTKLFYILIILVTASCSRKMTPQVQVEIRDSIVENTVYVTRDSLVYVPGDSVEVSFIVPCPDVSWMQEATSESGKTKVKAEINKGQLKVNCKTDSLEARIKWLEAQKNRIHRSYINTTTQKPPVRYIPKWMWWALIITGGISLYHFRKVIRRAIGWI